VVIVHLSTFGEWRELPGVTHDAGGNIVTDQRPFELYQYAYNNRNRMSSVTRNGAAYATYIYNALEQLVSRTTADPNGPTGTVHYIYDLDGHLIAEADAASGSITREYIWMPANDNEAHVDLPLAVVEGGALYHVHTDHLGRPVRMTNAAKATVWQASWKPWGEVQSISGTILNNLRFPGQYFQIETGLAYNWHRTYDPVTGRYTQPDPLGFVDGPSVYAYAGNSPFMNVDRNGLDLWVLGVEGSASSGLGVTGQGGGVYDSDTGGVHGYGSVGGTTGFGAYGGGGVGYFSGNLCEFTGTSVGWTFNFGFVQFTWYRSSGKWGVFISGGGGSGIPGMRGGTSGSVSTTRISGQDCKCPPSTM
jgi:RHS repeat-associated protein